MNACPVCGYDKLEFPPANFTICACCGTEFGYDDRVLSHYELRKKWIRDGCQWFDSGEQKPLYWNPYTQMTDAKLNWEFPSFTIQVRLQYNATIRADETINLGVPSNHLLARVA
jgi:hypothetical protein